MVKIRLLMHQLINPVLKLSNFLILLLQHRILMIGMLTFFLRKYLNPILQLLYVHVCIVKFNFQVDLGLARRLKCCSVAQMQIRRRRRLEQVPALFFVVVAFVLLDAFGVVVVRQVFQLRSRLFDVAWHLVC